MRVARHAGTACQHRTLILEPSEMSRERYRADQAPSRGPGLLPRTAVTKGGFLNDLCLGKQERSLRTTNDPIALERNR